MKLQTFSEHTIDTDLLTGGICIDVGCRGFQFSEAMRDMGLKVLAFDLEFMEAPGRIHFVKMAIAHKEGEGHYTDTKDQQAKYLSPEGIPVLVTTLNRLYESMLNVKSTAQVDVLKLDCEGSEYLILSDPEFKPIPRQITVEFHEHCHKELHNKYFDACISNLLKHYRPVQHVRDSRHGAGFNYWDSLFIRNDLL